jgi:hypothetical protein
MRKMRNLDTFRLIAKPMKAFKKRFNGVDGDKTDPRDVLVGGIVRILKTAAEAEGVKNRVKIIIISERPVVMSEAMANDPCFFNETIFKVDPE